VTAALTGEPRFFLDRGMGSLVVPRALRHAGWLVTTMDERYGSGPSQNIADVDWISDASSRGECIVAKDAAIARRSHEAATVAMCDARVFAITNAQITGPSMVR
jgi:hypothetical protein